MTAARKQFWTEFMALYESFPCMWRMKSPDYKNRKLKDRAYSVLVDKLREIQPNADRHDVVRKINTFRTNLRREMKKIQKSKRAASRGEGEIHLTTLWYFENLKFLLNSGDSESAEERDSMSEGGTMYMNENTNASTLEYVNCIRSPSPRSDISELTTKDDQFSTIETSSHPEAFNYTPFNGAIQRRETESASHSQHSNGSCNTSYAALCHYIQLELGALTNEDIKDDLCQSILAAVFAAKRKERQHQRQADDMPLSN